MAYDVEIWISVAAISEKAALRFVEITLGAGSDEFSIDASNVFVEETPEETSVYDVKLWTTVAARSKKAAELTALRRLERCNELFKLLPTYTGEPSRV